MFVKRISVSTSLGFWQGSDDVRVAGIGDGQCADAEVSTAGRSQLDVVAVVVVDAGLGQHRVVFDLGFSKWNQEALKRLDAWDAALEPFRRHLRNEKCEAFRSRLLHRVSIGLILLSHRNDSIWFQLPSQLGAEEETLLRSNLFPTTAILTSNGACCWRWWSTWPFLGGESSRSAYSPSRICPISWLKPNGSWCFLKPFSGRDKRMEISSDVAGCCEHNLKIFMFQKNYFMIIIKGL